jgi:hypothetical protein
MPMIRWPSRLCEYTGLQLLDLSYAILDASHVNVSCLHDLKLVNLSATQLKTVPHLISKRLSTVDLSNNRINTVDGAIFRSSPQLRVIILRNNPLKQIDHFHLIIGLPRLQRLNLLSSLQDLPIPTPINVTQWINLAQQWAKMNRSLVIRTNSFVLQSILPERDQLPLIPMELMRTILIHLSTSSMTALASTPQCHCDDLTNYQRVFAFVDNHEVVPTLFQSTTCLMSNGVIYARLFDRRTSTDLNCTETDSIVPLQPRMSGATSIDHAFLCVFSMSVLVFLF